MKKLFAIILCALTALSLCACSDKGDGSTLMYDYKDLSEYIEVGNYKGIEVDLESADVLKHINTTNEQTLSDSGLGDEAEIASGSVQDGDTVHITYVGKMDGEAFSGGSTTDDGTDLTIGSGSYIDGFEDGLIGAKPGETVVLNLEFPDPYPNNTSLAGKPVEFTVTVETITRTTYPEVTEDIAKQLGYDSVAAYEDDIKKTAVQTYLFNTVCESAKVLNVPETELNYYVDSDIEYYKSYATSMGTTFESLLSMSSMTEDEFKKQLKENYKSGMGAYMTVYYIAKENDLTVSKTALEKEYSALASNYSMTVSSVKEQIDDKQLEYSVLYDNVIDFLYKNAEIK